LSQSRQKTISRGESRHLQTEQTESCLAGTDQYSRVCHDKPCPGQQQLQQLPLTPGHTGRPQKVEVPEPSVRGQLTNQQLQLRPVRGQQYEGEHEPRELQQSPRTSSKTPTSDKLQVGQSKLQQEKICRQQQRSCWTSKQIWLLSDRLTITGTAPQLKRSQAAPLNLGKYQILYFMTFPLQLIKY